jgi:hypothetical protein
MYNRPPKNKDDVNIDYVPGVTERKTGLEAAVSND